VSAQQDTRGGGSLQLGVQKYLYTGYFVTGCIVAYLAHQIVDKAMGEGHDMVASIAGVVIGLGTVIFAWRNTRIRTLAQETIDELSKVTWPTRQETYTATVVVIATALVSATVIFALDRFWSWATDLIFR
jgi:preprotein translocase SecE subunit